MSKATHCKMLVRLMACCLLLWNCQSHAFADSPASKAVHQYLFVSYEPEKIHDPAFLHHKGFEGAQVTYWWRDLEPQENSYDFRAIRKDLAFLTAHHKRLFIQLEDVTFYSQYKCVPRYLLNDPRFHGGVAQQYSNDGKEAQGWVARRWDPAVRGRFQKLMMALGKAFDGKIEGINLEESAVNIPVSGPQCPSGFTAARYRDGLVDDMAALKRAFPKSVTMQFANFMPGDEDGNGYLRSLYDHAKELKVGVGGPDMLPYRPYQMSHSYPLIRAAYGQVPTGIAVQDGDYHPINPKTGKPTTIPELLEFGKNYLKVNYIFWCTQEPFYSKELLPYLKHHSQSSKL